MYRGAEDHPLRETTERWLALIEKAKQVKERLFGEVARECMSFYNGPHDFMYGAKNAKNAIGMYLDSGTRIKTTFKVTTNKVAELVQRFGPSLYFNNPHRQVGPRSDGMNISPMTLGLLGPIAFQSASMMFQQTRMIDQARGELASWLLNYTPNELDLKRHSRMAITESLIKGLGVAWTEVYQPRPDVPKLIGTFADSCDRLIIDPDADTIANARWIVRECFHPVWEVEDEYGWPRGSIKGNLESAQMASAVEQKMEFNRQRLEGKTNDILCYYKIWSKMGIGGRLKDADADMQPILDAFGDNVFLVVAKGVPGPLNMPPEMFANLAVDPGAADAIEQSVQWPIPYWADNIWPMSDLGYHIVPGSPYPMSHLKPALGELRFINWCLSFLADKVYMTSRDFLVVADHAFDDLKPQLKEGGDLEILRIKKSIDKKIGDVVQFLQHPPMNRDVLEIVQLAMQMFDKRVGLTDLLYGATPRQFRSAAEADVKREMSTIVVDDMAEVAHQWQTQIARKEGLANRWLMSPADVAPLYGETFGPNPMNPLAPQIGPLTFLWQQLMYSPIVPGDTESIYRVVRELDYRIEADSLRKPDTDRDLANIDQFLQSPFAQVIVQRYMALGDPTQVNALMEAWCKPRQLDSAPFMFPAFQPMPMQPQQPAA